MAEANKSQENSVFKAFACDFIGKYDLIYNLVFFFILSGYLRRNYQQIC